MFQKINKAWIIIVAVFILLVLLNPTYLNFKEFTGLAGKDAEDLHKKANFLICSIYQNNDSHRKYFGILKNFIDITPEPPSPRVNNMNLTVRANNDSNITIKSSVEKPKFDSTKPYTILAEGDSLFVSANLSSRRALDKLQILHDVYSKKFVVGSFPSFVRQMGDPIKRKNIYKTLSEEYNIGTYKFFQNKIDSFYGQ